MNIRFPRLAGWLGIAGCLACFVGCAGQSSSLLPARVDGVPGGTYHVRVSEHPATGQKYDAVLFETDAASVTLDVPTVEEGRGASAATYQAGMRPGAVVYEIRDTAGKVHGYLMVPFQARVRVWEQTGKGGALMVTVSDVGNMPEMGGGGAGGGGGM
ncbi:MAG TPA: hypothetical protein VGQ74_00350 [Methylomirabilota bacterium]|jgi:hypothetical protein|nr:hypothetical protein [Methylomirabilota bacterium]